MYFYVWLLFCCTWCLWDSSTLLSMSVVHFFSFQGGIPWYEYRPCVYPFSYWWTLAFFPFGGYFELSSHEHSYRVCLISSPMHFLWKSALCPSAERSMARLWGAVADVQPAWIPASTFPRQLHWVLTCLPLYKMSVMQIRGPSGALSVFLDPYKRLHGMPAAIAIVFPSPSHLPTPVQVDSYQPLIIIAIEFKY